MFQRFIETSASVQSFAVHENIYTLSGRRIQVFSGATHEKIAEIQLFEKDGLARAFILDDDFIYCKDFIHLYILDRVSLRVVAKMQLGVDLSSDICGMATDQEHVFVGIRNGAVARIQKGAWGEAQFFSRSASSIWDMVYDTGKLYAGNVEGQLLVIDAGTMEVEQRIQAHTQNLKSLCLLDHLIATASQDKSLALWDKRTLEQIVVKKNAHKKAFAIAGVWNDDILTVSFPRGEIKVWYRSTLREKAVLPVAPCLSGQTILHQGLLYLASRAIHGIDYVEIIGFVK